MLARLLVLLALLALGCKNPFEKRHGGPVPTPTEPIGGALRCYETGEHDIWAPVPGELVVPRDLGKILACEHGARHSAASVTMSDQYVRHGWIAANGYEEFVIQYVSQGPIGTPRRVTARLYLPIDSDRGHTIVAVNHGTNGLGPRCGPTHAPAMTDYMAIPLVTNGYAVVASDYIGMGVDEGVFSYGVGEAEAMSILDGVRALRSFKDVRAEGYAEEKFFLFGHSQGGQATLFAHEKYAASMGLELLGSLTFAPGFGDIRGLNRILGPPEHAMDPTMIFVTMVLYSHASYAHEPADAMFKPSERAPMNALLHDRCWADLASSIPARWPRESDLFTPEFLRAAKSCSFTTPCPGFESSATHLAADIPGSFHSTIPALLIQGGRDAIVPPYTTACVAKRLQAHGTPVTACSYASSDHFTIVDDAMLDALAWMSDRRSGKHGTWTGCRAPLATTCPP